MRYLVRRLRRILPEGATILVGFWCDEGGGAGVKALEATAEADAYATSLKEAARFCVDAARAHEATTASDSTTKDGKAPALAPDTPAKSEAPAKDKAAPARVA